jgi:uncharacterized protein YecT (DUF1311 family)
MSNNNDVTLKAYLSSDDVKIKIGPKTDFYLTKWQKHLSLYGEMKLSNPELKKIGALRGWNWGATCFTIFWGIWRGIAISWGVFAFLAISTLAGFFYPGSFIDKIGSNASLPIAIVYGMYGNSWYLDSLIKQRSLSAEDVKPSLKRLAIPIGILILIFVFGSYHTMKDDESSESAPTPAAEQALAAAAEPTPAPAAAAEPTPVPAPVAAVDNSPFSPSFDCAKASNGQEKLICADRELSKLDVNLSQAYAKAEENTADKDKLKKEQLEWIKFSLRACSDKTCLVGTYQKRISELQ